MNDNYVGTESIATSAPISTELTPTELKTLPTIRAGIERVSFPPQTEIASANRKSIPNSSYILLSSTPVDFSTARSWDQMSEDYNQFIEAKLASRSRKKDATSKILMEIPYKWHYAEEFTFSPLTHKLTFLRRNPLIQLDKRTPLSLLSFSHSLI